MTELSVSHFR